MHNMTINQTLHQFTKMLENLDGLLVKAAAFADHKKFDVNVLANARLAPDMLPFTSQIQFATDAAKFCAAQLSGKEAPKFEDTEKTWTELRERIKKTIVYLNTFKESDFSQAESKKISPKWAQGQWLTGTEYFYQLAIPNFYFHMTTAYALLREAGVDIGKQDFIGHLNFKKP